MPAQIEIEGIKKLSRQLKQLDGDLLKELKSINKEAAEKVADEARSLVPVRSGTLKSSIRASGLQSTGVVRSGNKSVPYANVIHFGWRRHNIEPNPFLYDALDERRQEVLATYEKQLNQLIDKVN